MKKETGTENFLKPYIEWKFDYLDISNYKIEKNIFSEERNSYYKILNHIEDHVKKN